MKIKSIYFPDKLDEYLRKCYVYINIINVLNSNKIYPLLKTYVRPKFWHFLQTLIMTFVAVN